MDNYTENSTSNTTNLDKQQDTEKAQEETQKSAQKDTQQETQKDTQLHELKHYICEVGNELMAKTNAVCGLVTQFAAGEGRASGAARTAGAVVFCSNKSEAEVTEKIIRRKGIDARRSWEKLIDAAHLFNTSMVTGFAGRITDRPVDESIPKFKEVFTPLAERAQKKGGYALGSGNSIPVYVPPENYMAMIAAAVFNG